MCGSICVCWRNPSWRCIRRRGRRPRARLAASAILWGPKVGHVWILRWRSNKEGVPCLVLEALWLPWELSPVSLGRAFWLDNVWPWEFWWFVWSSLGCGFRAWSFWIQALRLIRWLARGRGRPSQVGFPLWVLDWQSSRQREKGVHIRLGTKGSWSWSSPCPACWKDDGSFLGLWTPSILWQHHSKCLWLGSIRSAPGRCLRSRPPLLAGYLWGWGLMGFQIEAAWGLRLSWSGLIWLGRASRSAKLQRCSST